MEMRETVERMVMVRTTGSDLQPAATGYIYKKESNRPASVITMGESEVMEHLSKFSDQPEAFAAPVPVAAGPFYAKQENDRATSDFSETKVIPVVEVQEENKDNIDGIAKEDYGHIMKEYESDFGNYNSDFDDYLKSLGYFADESHREHGDEQDHTSEGYRENDNKEQEGSKSQRLHGKGGAGIYSPKKYRSYELSGKGGNKGKYDDSDEFSKYYASRQGFKEGDHDAPSKGEEVEGFYKLFDKDQYNKDHDLYDDETVKAGFHDFSKGHTDRGSDAGRHIKGSFKDSGYHEDNFRKGGHQNKESSNEHNADHSTEQGSESSQQQHFGAKGGKYDGKSYGYEIKHWQRGCVKDYYCYNFVEF